MGQGKYLMNYRNSANRIFYDSTPVFVISTVAAVIASQTMIYASFSCVKQSMSLGCFPRMKIVHTSKRLIGQIYIPVINWFLMIMCILVVATFRSTTDIANAYVIFSNMLYFMEYAIGQANWLIPLTKRNAIGFVFVLSDIPKVLEWHCAAYHSSPKLCTYFLT